MPVYLKGCMKRRLGEKVRTRNGWEDLFKPGKEFSTFLERQEKVIGELMSELGFLQ